MDVSFAESSAGDRAWDVPGHSFVHISFKQVHEVHMFQSTTSWDVNRRPPPAAGGLDVKYRLLSELADPLTS